MMLGKITLFGGDEVLVDKKDFDWLSTYKWYLAKRGRNNYCYAIVEGSPVLMHRLLLNPPSDKEIDHINHNGLDNRRENLRITDRAGNSQNHRLRLDNKSGYKGVDYHRHKNKWRARITVNSKEITLGYFNSPEEAYEKRKEAAKEYHGEYGFNP
jgi:hypothetical protein